LTAAIMSTSYSVPAAEPTKAAIKEWGAARPMTYGTAPGLTCAPTSERLRIDAFGEELDSTWARRWGWSLWISGSKRRL
jgi:hypothetical protein